MSQPIDAEFATLLKHSATVKVVATPEEDGTPHLEINSSIHLDTEGRLVLLEADEYSRTNRNLVRSLWFGKRIAIHVWGGDEHQFLVIGRPYKAVISGPLFEFHYRQQQRPGEVSPLSAVWLIDPVAISDEAPSARRVRESAGRQPLIHLDRIANRVLPRTPAA